MTYSGVVGVVQLWLAMAAVFWTVVLAGALISVYWLAIWRLGDLAADWFLRFNLWRMGRGR